MEQPLVLELKGNSLDDGPGIRTAIFFKGCPLNCIWCHNPESKHVGPELSVAVEDCIGCGTCVSLCPVGAADLSRPGIVDREKCIYCFLCTQHCPPKGLQEVGKKMDIEEIVRQCVSDKPFYDVSGGGVTLSGGECTLFPEWVGALAKRLTEEGIHVHVETAGLFRYEMVREHLLPYVSSIYMDIKLIDSDLHKRYCGVPNEVILDNFRRLWSDREAMDFTLLPRTPLIPDITDTDENLKAIAAFYREVGVTETELLPYNPTWYGKNRKLGIELAEELKGLDSWQTPEKIARCKSIFEAVGITCK